MMALRMRLLLLVMVVVLLLLQIADGVLAAVTIPTHELAGGGSMPMMIMGGSEFAGWFEIAGKGAGIQTFHGYGNGAHLAPQIAKVGRENVFVSTGIPCGCCGSDGPKVKPVTFAEATGYIEDELSQLNTTYADLLLFHHRCDTAAETAAVWEALEAAKAAGKARHIGVSNFNTNDLEILSKTAKQPIEVLEAHFGVGIFDFEVVKWARQNNIHPVSFSSLSEGSTDLPGLAPTVAKIAATHSINTEQVMYAYVHQKNITVLSSYDPTHPDWVKQDLAIFDIRLSDIEMLALDKLTTGNRTCTDCYTTECQACGQALIKAGCPVGALHGGFIWGRSNPKGQECVECAANNHAAIAKVCNPGRGESLETMVPKACQI
jgi:diketogulonate reductase-like aldo/keto reductase